MLIFSCCPGKLASFHSEVSTYHNIKPMLRERHICWPKIHTAFSQVSQRSHIAPSLAHSSVNIELRFPQLLSDELIHSPGVVKKSMADESAST